MKAKRKVASRFFLPTEMLLGYALITVGLSGTLHDGALYQSLVQDGFQRIWVVSLVVVGTLQFVAAMSEWGRGRNCPLHTVYRFAQLRTTAAFFSGAAWLVMAVYLLVTARLYISISFIAPGAAFFCAWSYRENYMVKDSLDEKVSTDTIVFHR